MKITDENIVQRIKQKDEQTIDYLVKTYGGLLNGVIRKYLMHNEQDMEECFADVLVSIWFHIDYYDETKNEFKQWMAAIAKYRAIDYIRRTEKIKLCVSNYELDENRLKTSPNNLMEMDLQSLLDELTDIERSIFEKYYVEGVPTDEIASTFRAKPSWVHNKLSRGRKKLKTIILKGEV